MIFMQRLCAKMILAAGLVFANTVAAATLPSDVRSWTHTKSMVISDKANALYGFHHIYANDTALKTLKKGGTYADGATFVVAFFEVINEQGSITAGTKIMDVMMRKDVGTAKSAAATGGWIYSAFDAKGRAKSIDAAKDCHVCHQSQAAKDFIFSSYAD